MNFNLFMAVFFVAPIRINLVSNVVPCHLTLWLIFAFLPYINLLDKDSTLILLSHRRPRGLVFCWSFVF